MSEPKHEVWLQISAGQGPAECAWAVVRTVEEIQRDMERRGLNIRSFGQLLLDAHWVGNDQFYAKEKDSNDARA